MNKTNKESKTPLLDKYASIINAVQGCKDLDDAQKEDKLESIIRTRYLKLTNDFAFKLVFERDKNLLIALLNDILKKNIDSIEYIPNEIQGATKDGKKVLIDVHCKSQKEEFIVEMQNVDEENFKSRLLYYGASDIHNQLPKGAQYNFAPVYVIALMNFRYPHKDADENKLVYNYVLSETESHEVFSDKLKFILCELDRMQDRDIPGVNADPVRQCLWIIKNLCNFAGDEVDIPERYRPILRIARISDLEENDIENYITSMLSEDNIQAYTNAAFSNGLREGLEKGREAERIEIAKSMLAKGYPVNAIADLTGLSLEEIDKLK